MGASTRLPAISKPINTVPATNTSTLVPLARLAIWHERRRLPADRHLVRFSYFVSFPPLFFSLFWASEQRF